MNKTVIMLMGKSGSGKTTLEHALVTKYPNLFYKVVSMTTRPMRKGEENGVDYWFETPDRFHQYDCQDELIQKTKFAGHRYGSLYREYLTPHPYAILVVVPSSAATFIPTLKENLPNVKVVLVYFDITDKQLRANMIKRGDNPKESDERLATDDLDTQFKISGLTADFIVNDDMLTPDLHKEFVKQYG